MYDRLILVPLLFDGDVICLVAFLGGGITAVSKLHEPPADMFGLASVRVNELFPSRVPVSCLAIKGVSYQLVIMGNGLAVDVRLLTEIS